MFFLQRVVMLQMKFNEEVHFVFDNIVQLKLIYELEVKLEVELEVDLEVELEAVCNI